MATHEAYLLMDANSPETPDGIIWWDGKHTRASSDAILRRLKKMFIPFGESIKSEKNVATIGDGKKFFDMLPLAFRSGYTYLKKAKVDESGKLV